MKLILTAMMATTLMTIALAGEAPQNPRDGNTRSADRHQAPTGHRQPRAQDLPPDVREREGTVVGDGARFRPAAQHLPRLLVMGRRSHLGRRAAAVQVRDSTTTEGTPS
jgi:hypothetical protein